MRLPRPGRPGRGEGAGEAAPGSGLETPCLAPSPSLALGLLPPPAAPASEPAGLLVVWLPVFLAPRPLLYNVLVYFILFLGSLVIFK